MVLEGGARNADGDPLLLQKGDSQSKLGALEAIYAVHQTLTGDGELARVRLEKIRKALAPRNAWNLQSRAAPPAVS